MVLSLSSLEEEDTSSPSSSRQGASGKSSQQMTRTGAVVLGPGDKRLGDSKDLDRYGLGLRADRRGLGRNE